LYLSFISVGKSFYKLKLSYCGAKYLGWQIQTKTSETIQGKFNTAFINATNILQFKTIGASRTDTGVHAFGQIVRVESNENLPEDAFLKGVNNHLPKDIRVVDVEKVDEKFHPIFSAKQKEYLYVLSNNSLSPFLFPMMTYYRLGQEQLTLMKLGLELFIGRHDFINYRCVGTDVNSTIREIFFADICQQNIFSFGDVSINGDFIVIRILGEGFLKQMVRLIVGTLFSLAEGKISLSDIEQSFSVPMDQKLGKVALPNGLYLNTITY